MDKTLDQLIEELQKVEEELYDAEGEFDNASRTRDSIQYELDEAQREVDFYEDAKIRLEHELSDLNDQIESLDNHPIGY